MAYATSEHPAFASLLAQCVSEPGIISAAYSAFHRYSFGNMIAAACQLTERGQTLGPIASFMAWKDHGRSVKKGAKAIALCMPVTQRGIREVEAESVAFLCCALLGLPGLKEARGYVQSWLGSADIPEKSAQRIYRAADRILKAGRIEETQQ